MTAAVAFAIVAIAFALGDYVALKTKGLVSAFVVVIFAFLIGGNLGFIPGDVVDVAGITSIIATFGMAFLLVNLGSTLDLNELIKEWQTVLISLAGLVGVIALCCTVGMAIFGRETALAAIAPITGGVVATMLTTAAATEAGFPSVATFVSCIMGFQMVLGIPIASVCLKKAAKRYIDAGKLNEAVEVKTTKKINIKFVPDTHPDIDSPATHFARIALVAGAAIWVAGLTGLNGTLLYLIFGALASATGIIEKNSLKKAGADGIILIAAYAYCAKDFVSLTISEFLSILPAVAGMLILGAIGVAIMATIVGKIFKWDFYLSIASAISCMFGYPVTFAIPTEVVAGAKIDYKLSDDDAAKLQAHLMPKMIIAGVTTVSITSVIIAGVLVPILFG